MDSPRIDVKPATLLGVTNTPNEDKKVAKQGCIVEVQFETDLDYEKVEDQHLRDLTICLKSCFIFGGMAQDKIKNGGDLRREMDQVNKITVFLCGGPGDKNEPHRNLEFNREYLKDNGCLIFLNYRGTGDVAEIRDTKEKPDSGHLEKLNKYMELISPWFNYNKARDDQNTVLSPEETIDMATLLKHFRQDSIVRDLEAIRKCFFESEKTLKRNRKWDIFGQSYGGWISLTYLSLYPEALNSSTITAGLAPITASPNETYAKLFQELKHRNDEYYETYPSDIRKVKNVVRFLLSQVNEDQPRGLKIGNGYLTAQRFLCFGRSLGARKGFETLHNVLTKLDEELPNLDDELTGKEKLSFDALNYYSTEDSWNFDRRPLYAVLHEAMYCRAGVSSNWSAQRVADGIHEFRWAAKDRKESSDLLRVLSQKDNKEKIYFSGEMVYRFMFEDYAALESLAGVADRLAQHVWTDPYNDQVLLNNTVPVDALSYATDMHVNPRLSEATAALIGEIRHKELTMVPGKGYSFQHASLRTDTVAVFEALGTL